MMSRSRLGALVAGAVMSIVLAPPAGAQQTKPIREMTWRAHVGIATTHESTVNTPLVKSEMGTSTVTSGGTSHTGGGSIANVEIHVGVIGLLPDDGLAVTVSESGDRKSEPVRVDVRGDGGTIVAPGDTEKVTPEETRLIALLGRRIVGGRDVGPGSTWTQTSGDKTVKATSRYTVMSYANEVVTVDVDQTVRAGGVRPIDMHTTGRFSYDLQYSVPVSAKLATRSHEGSPGNLTTWDLSFEYELIADSLSARKPK